MTAPFTTAPTLTGVPHGFFGRKGGVSTGDLASLNSHVDQNGFLLDNTAPNSYLYGVLDKIMGYFK